MTDLIETRLRELFADDADHAPLAADLTAGARGIARRQTRRRVAVLGSGLLVALVVGSTAVLSNAHSGQGSAPAATSTPTPSPATSTSSTPTSDEPSALYYRNVEVPVPAAMLAPDAVRCGTPVADAAYVDTGAHRSCLATPPHPERLTTVVLQPTEDLRGRFRAGTRVLPDGRTEISSGVPGGDLRIVVTSPDPKLADKLFGGLVIVQMAHGCAVQDSGMRQPILRNPQGSVQGGSVCAYQRGWLVGSAWLDEAQAAQVTDLLRAPVDTAAACPSPSGVPAIEYWVVHLRYPSTEELTDLAFDACNATPLTERLWELATPP